MAENDGEDPWDFLGASKAKSSPEPSSVSADPPNEQKAEEPSAKVSIADLMPARKAAAPSDSAGSDDDAWGFLATRKADVAARVDAGEVPVARVEKREAGEFRADMGGVSLKRRAWPMALALALVSVVGFLTETVAATQLISLAGAQSLFWVYPLGGVGLIFLAVLQFRFVDQHARLTVLRIATLFYALGFIILLLLLGSSIAPVISVAIIYLLGDQLNFLIPLLIWSLAGDEFNVAEGRKIFGWIIAWTYGGQVAGLILATASPAIFSQIEIPLPTILVLDPLVCLFVGIWLPRQLKGTFAAKGSHKSETFREAVSGAADFINGVPVWRTLLFGSIITFIGGMTVFLSFMTGESDLLGSDAGSLQTFFGAVMLGSLVICLITQIFCAERLQEAIGIPGVLIILPVMTVLAGLLLAVGIVLQSLPLLALGLACWFIPRWSIDENARRGALALVPDERRTRVSFIVDLLPISTGLIIAGPLAAIAYLTGYLWAIPLLGAVITVFAIPLAFKVKRGWEDSLMNWRLRRRKQNRTLALGEE